MNMLSVTPSASGRRFALLPIALLLFGVSHTLGFLNLPPIPAVTRRIHPALRPPLFATIQDFQFQGHSVYSEVHPASGDGDRKNNDVILIHGFACSTVYWRATVETLQRAGYTVHALDLLGQGRSAKPGRKDGIEYSIRLWAEQVGRYVETFVPPGRGLVLVGNSLGSVVALAVAAGDSNNATKRIHGVGMYNCGVGMNSRNILLQFEGLSKVLFTVLFNLFDVLVFGNLPLLTYLLDKVVTKELLRDALTGLYKYGEDRVDDELVDSFFLPARDAGSPECMSQIYTNDPGSTPMQIYEAYNLTNLPIHLVWGTEDPVTPISGSVGVFFTKLAADPDSKVSMDTLPAGHIPFDEVPDCNLLMLKWLESIDAAAATSVSSTKPSSVFGDFKFPFFN